MPATWRAALSVVVLLFATPAVIEARAANTTQVGGQASVDTGALGRLAPGDEISISVFGEPDLTMSRVRIPSSGIIAYPLIGSVRVESDTPQSLAEKIEIRLRDGYLVKPQVSVSVVRYRPIFVVGAVQTPGTMQYVEGMTIDRALALAGGLSQTADPLNLEIERETGEILAGITPKDRTRIYPGDTVRIPTIEIVEPPQEVISYFYVYGEVRSPGRYEFSDQLTVEKALALAGGFTARASKRKISITREADPPLELKKVDLQEELADGDVITVGARLF